ncbi:SMP-30/gluconolactonase/LRE family protein [Fulvivirgaceae bacterium BMA10]|uniref:SMP-30/gluconolactonase/LRE family protein n=1 Tax=Splendidivirga corallicola TaxID=3051826 RepID=A0ABT8KVM4_9BACT|nr:SMP-30/gluconolactonase/LRE family protein [Fulvivirgaceae bacterium BMA10]
MKNSAFIVILCFSIACQNNPGNRESNTQMAEVKDFTAAVFTTGIEGPAVDANGNLYVVNLNQEGTIGKVDENGRTEVFAELPNGSIGNGIRFNSDFSMMFIADYINHNILQIDMKSRELSIYAHQKDSINQPNDVAIMKNDILFASDPNWGESTGNLWRVDKDGSFHLLEKNMGTTNGVEVGPNDDILYVNESVQRKVWAYDLNEKGEISNKRLFIEFPDHGMDGMRCDVKGNLYITRHGKGTIAIISPEGELIQEIELKGKKPSNIAFGGEDGRTCYVTLQDRKLVETFKASFPGRSRK